MNLKIKAIGILLFIKPLSCWAQSGAGSYSANDFSFLYQAEILDASENVPTSPVSVRFEIVGDSTGSCVLYAEDHANINLVSSNGLVSLKVGSGTPVLGLGSAGQNSLHYSLAVPVGSTSVSGRVSASSSAANCSVSGLSRFLRVSINGEALSPLVDIGATPRALLAQEARFAGIAKSAVVNNVIGQFGPLSVLNPGGTADATTFLRGDGSWQPISGSSGGTVTNVSGTAPVNVTNSSTTPIISIADASASTKGIVQIGAGLSVASGIVSLAPSGVTAGSFGSSTSIPVIQVDSHGRVTSVTTQSISGGGGSPTGAAGGDLSGSYPNPVVNKIQGRTVSSTSPTAGQVLIYNGTQWEPQVLPSPGTLSNITSLSSSTGISLSPGASNSVAVNSNMSSFSPTTGALIVSGGLGVAQNINAGGPISAMGQLRLSATAPNAVRSIIGEGTNGDNGYLVISGGNTDSVGARITLSGGTAGSPNEFVGNANSYKFKDSTNMPLMSILPGSGSGNIGIGTDTPADMLHLSSNVAGSRGIAIENLNASGISQMTLKSSSSSTSKIAQDFTGILSIRNYSSSNSTISFANGGASPSERLTINHTGNVGIGTTSPAAKLQVEGNFKLGTQGSMFSAIGYCDAIVSTSISVSQVVSVPCSSPSSVPFGAMVSCSLSTPPGTTTVAASDTKALYKLIFTSGEATGQVRAMNLDIYATPSVGGPFTFRCMWMLP